MDSHSKTSHSLCLQETCRKLHALIDKVDEERYDLQTKLGKAEKEVNLKNDAPLSLPSLCKFLRSWLEYLVNCC